MDANHGSCIFNVSLNNLIKNLDSQNEVQFVDFLNTGYRLNEIFRTLKIHKAIPFYNFQRYLTLNHVTQENLSIEKIINLHNREGLSEDLNAREFDTLIAGKVIWEVSDDSLFRFPNIFWMSKRINAKKIAYAVSGHLTNLETFRQHKKQVFDILCDYRLIGVRDKMTQIMMEEAGIDKVLPVFHITDPAFLYEQKPVDSNALFAKFGISKERPILGMLYYGKEKVSEKVCKHFHQKGYQILNFNMLNPYADLNIGHLVDIDEWVELIKHLDFCITDRFHVSVFCLRENIPFVAIEPYPPKTLLNSKIFSLLESFKVENTLYQDTYQENFDVDQFLYKCDELKANWNAELSKEIQAMLEVNNGQQKEFLKLVKKCIEE